MSSILSKLINLAGNITGTLAVANGGTGLTSGTSGGLLGFTGTTTIASSAALAAGGVVYGGGAGATPAATAAGTTSQVLIGGTTPSFGNVPAAALPLATSSTAGAVNPYAGTGVVYAGRWTPTIVAQSNAGAATGTSCYYSIIANIVTCSGYFVATSGSTATGTMRYTMTLPVTTSLTSSYANGTCVWSPVAGTYVAGYIFDDTDAAHTVELYVGNGASVSTAGNLAFTFQYAIS